MFCSCSAPSQLFDFLSALRAKSAFQSTDAHFTNLYHRLDYNDWYSQQYQSQSTTKSNNVVSPPAPAAAAASSAAAHHPRQLSSY
jgi:hypothetical protein